MKRLSRLGALLVVAVVAASGTPALAKKCPADSVQVGTLCVDTYEASLWSIPAASTSLIKKVQKGKAVLADLTAGGATQISPSTGQPGALIRGGNGLLGAGPAGPFAVSGNVTPEGAGAEVGFRCAR